VGGKMRLAPGARLLRIAGVDEAGRGPLAGPVVAAAVILAWGVGWSDSEEIDSLNILQASLLAMRRALLRLPLRPTHVQVDGNCPPRLQDLLAGCTVETIVKGDAKVDAISAASILAKTFRDALMERMDVHYPGFDLAAHKGYSTPAHLAALKLRAPSPLHRRSFEPVRQAISIMVLDP
jgi:ribonuclease HII